MNVMLDDRAFMPAKAHEDDAGYDLRAAKGYILHPHHKRTLETGVHIELPKDTVAYIKSRSSLFQRGLLADGTIDPGYTGPIMVTLHNISDERVLIKRGDKIAQMVFHETISPELTVVDKFKETERGNGGFGSTGR